MKKGDDRGQSTVEFALVLPLLLLLVLGLIQVGLFMRDHIMVAAAAREGAREAAVSSDNSRIRGAAERAAPGLDLSVSITRGSRRGDAAQVSIAARPTRVPLVGRIVSGRTIRSTATMRVEKE